MVKLSIGLLGIERLIGGDFANVVGLARQAEDAGIDMLSITDHVVMGEHLENYPYGAFPLPLDYPWFEPMVVLAAIAGGTERIRHVDRRADLHLAARRSAGEATRDPRRHVARPRHDRARHRLAEGKNTTPPACPGRTAIPGWTSRSRSASCYGAKRLPTSTERPSASKRSIPIRARSRPAVFHCGLA